MIYGYVYQALVKALPMAVILILNIGIMIRVRSIVNKRKSLKEKRQRNRRISVEMKRKLSALRLPVIAIKDPDNLESPAVHTSQKEKTVNKWLIIQ